VNTGGEPAAYDLGLEGGGTKTVALTSTGHRRQFGPLNLQLASDRQILAILRQFRPRRAALCLAGCRRETDRQRLRQLARRAWGPIPVFAGNDLDSGLAAAFGDNPGILVISGTGSVVVGRNAAGQTARAGGWGHILGDHGSGYWIALTGLRAAIRDYDRRGRAHAGLLRRLCLTEMEQLIRWAQTAGKADIAALADLFLEPGLMLQAASFLAQDAHAVAGKLALTAPRVVLTGGVLTHHRKLATLVSNRIRAMLPGAQVRVFRGDTAIGALGLAGHDQPLSPSAIQPVTLPLTELRNPRTRDLDRQSVAQLVDTMLAEEARVLPALRQNRRAIVRCINTLVTAFRRGGRLFYVGAGTSGRLGVLDASECPPTFSTDPAMVQAIMAGGAPALHSAVEAAEDDPRAGAEAIRQRAVTGTDVVVGIAASGTTPFVLGALAEAKRVGAKTFLLSFAGRTDSLGFATGPEVITGSTRLKAGTATKLVLNMLTTISMIRLGKVVSNLMVDVKPTNDKLRARACRILATLRECSESEARQRLEKSGWNLPRALRLRRSARR
jgi:N-acetylmuramic acid 6-phosphate etherase